MIPSRTLFCLVAGTLVASCAATGPRDASGGAPGFVPIVASTSAPATAVAVPRSRDLGAEELSIWRDPDFQRRFAESYLAETEVEPRITTEERDTMLEVMELISADRLNEAAFRLQGLVGPASSAVLDFTLANIRYQQDRLDEAAGSYLIAVEKFPNFRRAWGNLGQIQVRLGDFDAARGAFTRVIELGGGDAVTYGLLGFAYSNGGNHIAAESAYRMAMLLDPVTLDWKMGLAFSFFEQRRFADAVTLCDTLIAEQPESADLWLLQANAFIRLDQPGRAAENYELVDALGASTVASLTNLADIYVNRELFDRAVDAYLRALESDETGDVARATNAARVMTMNGALDATRRLLDGVESLHGSSLDTDQRKDLLKLRVRVAVAEGAGEEEAAMLHEIVALDPLDGEALILLGEHSRRSGDDQTAIFYFERAAAIEGFEADAKVSHARVLIGQSRYDEAIPLLQRAQKLDPRENVREYLERVERAAKGR